MFRATNRVKIEQIKITRRDTLRKYSPLYIGTVNISEKLWAALCSERKLYLRLRSYTVVSNYRESINMRRITAFLKNESGATAIEYGLIAAGISVVIIGTVNAIGSTLNTKFSFIENQLG
jgi:pilus assembly protein Flp/PilA